MPTTETLDCGGTTPLSPAGHVPPTQSADTSAHSKKYLIRFRGTAVQFCPTARWPTLSHVADSEATIFTSEHEARETIFKYRTLTNNLDMVEITTP